MGEGGTVAATGDLDKVIVVTFLGHGDVVDEVLHRLGSQPEGRTLVLVGAARLPKVGQADKLVVLGVGPNRMALDGEGGQSQRTTNRDCARCERSMPKSSFNRCGISTAGSLGGLA